MSQPDFVVIDVETANRGRHSICQIGIVGYRDGEECFAEETLVDPCDAFEPFNIAFHGISPQKVAGAPAFRDLHGWLDERLGGRIAVSHSNFDPSALSAACRRDLLSPIDSRWIDSVSVARIAWPGLPSYKLGALAKLFDIRFRHHDALEDARTAGQIVLRALAQAGDGIEDWLHRRPTTPSPGAQIRGRTWGEGGSVTRRPACDGPLKGHVVTVTGDLSVPRSVMADQVQAAGGAFSASVTRKTTLLVIGPHEGWGLGRGYVSAKQTKAEAAIAGGQPMRIIDEPTLRRIMAG